MNPANITRAEAQKRSALLTTESYAVTVELTGNVPDGADPGEQFVSTSTVVFEAFDPGDTWIDLIADAVLSASLDGTPLDPATFERSRLPFQITPGKHELSVTALCRYSHTGEGLHRFVDPADQRVYLYTQFETADARRMYACFEQPDLKATFQLTVTTAPTWKVISNSVAPKPEIVADVATWRFAPTGRISTYITALVAGDYHVEPGSLTSVNGEIPAALVCRESMVPYLDSAKLRETTQRGFAVYEQTFGVPYPFDSYDQVFAPEYNAGAMENAGCVTIRDEYLFRSKVTAAQYEARDNTILHELAHMWFGDLVTMRWWDDLWLNESFAEWASHYCQQLIVAEHGGVNPWVGFANGRKTWAFTADQLPTTHPVAADMVDLDTVEQSFDGITYAKGASVLKQLVAHVGEQQFLAGIHAYLKTHGWDNASFADLIDALQTASGRDLGGFASDWLETAGMDTLRPEVYLDSAGVITRFEVVQTARPEHPKLRNHHLSIGCYDLVDGQIVRTGGLEDVAIHDEVTPIAALVGSQRPLIVLLNAGDETFAKIRLDAASLTAAVDGIGKIADPLARAVIMTSAWDSWRDAEIGSRDFIELVLASVPVETDIAALQARLNSALTAAGGYSAPQFRQANRSYLVSRLGALLQQAEPGSDKQLSIADALIRAVNAPLGAAVLQAWLDGEEVPQGLAIDVDRRWAMLTTLAAIGELESERLSTMEAADVTISGVERAAGVRAALPTPEAKAEAWRLLTESADVPNGTARQIALNFMRHGQEEVLAPYTDKYLELVDAISGKIGIFSDRGNWITDLLLTYLWPEPLADEAYLARVADRLLAEPKLTEAVSRTVNDNLDGSRRKLAAQQASRKWDARA
ncbi:MAG: aminopeptidase N [Propionibacteriaceae bacterium]|jgi:aminopeptidase N|nr:aminopeptidase N [Propionibacteriaceae bacterium]